MLSKQLANRVYGLLPQVETNGFSRFMEKGTVTVVYPASRLDVLKLPWAIMDSARGEPVARTDLEGSPLLPASPRAGLTWLAMKEQVSSQRGVVTPDRVQGWVGR